MGRYRDRERVTVPDESWEPGQDAQVLMHPKWKIRRGPAAPALAAEPEEEPRPSLNDMPMYDPSQHEEPAELYSQDSIDRLEQAGFQPHERGVWHRPAAQGQQGPGHLIVHDPGQPLSDGTRAPWHLISNPDEVSQRYRALGGPDGAIAAADAAPIEKEAAAQTPGRANADDWLARNTDESFEHDPRAEARDWMDQNADQYDEWHPDSSDYSYRDFGDAAGQSFHGDEAAAHVLPGSAYDFGDAPAHGGMSDRDWERFHEERESRQWTPQEHEDHEQMNQQFHNPPAFFGNGYDDGDEDGESDADEDQENLGVHGFDWHPQDPTAGSPENPYTPETPGKYVKYQNDLEGNHIATHTLTPGGHQPGQWSLHTEVHDPDAHVTFPESVHGNLDWALDKYKRNSAEAMLPKYDYSPTYRNNSAVRYWTREDPAPTRPGVTASEPYGHSIHFTDHGFQGATINHTHLSNGALFAPNGVQTRVSNDLADIVGEQQRLGQGLHPGGHQDHRLTHDELQANPSVASLGHPETTHTPWGDGRVDRLTWNLPAPGDPRGLHVAGTYDWNTGNYGFRYGHNGAELDPAHEHVPAGAPVTVPGRPPQPPTESAR